MAYVKGLRDTRTRVGLAQNRCLTWHRVPGQWLKILRSRHEATRRTHDTYHRKSATLCCGASSDEVFEPTARSHKLNRWELGVGQYDPPRRGRHLRTQKSGVHERKKFPHPRLRFLRGISDDRRGEKGV